ncbi:hypothetical protein Tco_1089269, partial [Tanacetum coccineum]
VPLFNGQQRESQRMVAEKAGLSQKKKPLSKLITK